MTAVLTRVATALLFASFFATPRVSAQETSSLKERIGTGVLRGLYITTPIVHGVDTFSTFKVIDLGGRELNPLLARTLSNRAGFAATKAGIAAGEIYLTHLLGKRHKFGAIAALAGLNIAYSMFAAHNLRVADRMERQQALRR